MRPLKRNQTLVGYAKEATVALIRRAGLVMEKKGTDASWDVIFDAIKAESELMREVSPASFIIYESYLAAAIGFLANFPDGEKVIELAQVVSADLEACADFSAQMKVENFTIEDRAMIIASGETVTAMMRSLNAQFQR